MSHYLWTKESKDFGNKKLNGKKKKKKKKKKKTSEIKKFYWERDVFKPQKLKKKKNAIIYKENDFGIYFRNQRLSNFNILKHRLGFFWIFRIRCGF